MKILEMKSMVAETKNAFSKLISQLDITKETPVNSKIGQYRLSN